MKTSEMIKVMQAFEDGKQIESMYFFGSAIWRQDDFPLWAWNSIQYRIKQELKPVDMSVLIESGIDCEFSDGGITWRVGQLIGTIYEEGLYQDGHYTFWKHCRPRMNHVHAWQGGECPLPEGVVVRIYDREGEWGSTDEHAVDHDWGSNGYQWDIIAFEVVGLVDGYVWSEE